MRPIADQLLGRFRHRARQALLRPFQIKAAPPSDPDEELERAYAAYASRAMDIGLADVRLFLSFDCDTEQDPEAAHEVTTLMQSLGFKGTFAVPGTELRRNAESYQRLLARGVEFMNHGERPHAAWEHDRYVSVTFYEKMTFAEVEADMRAGHRTVHDVLGIRPQGFRAPHFGHFQEPAQLALVHRVARDLGYRYCSTTLPAYGLIHGPAHDAGGGLIELATFGTARSPTSLLDSWSHLTDRRDYALSDVFETLLIDTVDRLHRLELPALLTWYVDPAHVAGQAAFERSLNHLARRGVPSLGALDAALLAWQA